MTPNAPGYWWFQRGGESLLAEVKHDEYGGFSSRVANGFWLRVRDDNCPHGDRWLMACSQPAAVEAAIAVLCSVRGEAMLLRDRLESQTDREMQARWIGKIEDAIAGLHGSRP